MTRFTAGVAILVIALAFMFSFGNIARATTGFEGRSGSYSDTVNKFGSDKAINSARGIDTPLEAGKFNFAEPYDFQQDLGR